MTNMKTRPPTSNIAPFGLRMQPDLRDRIEEAAAESGRSLNAEIVHRLEQTLAPAKSDLPALDLERRLLVAQLDLSFVSKIAETISPLLPADLPEKKILSKLAKRYRLSDDEEEALEHKHRQGQRAFMQALLDRVPSIQRIEGMEQLVDKVTRKRPTE